jgi:hypothetical protein
VLFDAGPPANLANAAQIVVSSLQTGERRDLVGRTSPRYALTGHLVYAQGATLMAVPFDPQRLALTGSPVPVLEGVLQSPPNWSRPIQLFEHWHAGLCSRWPSGSSAETVAGTLGRRGMGRLGRLASFGLPGAALNGLLTGAAGKINGTTRAGHNVDRVGVGTGVYVLGAPRQIEFGLRLTF